MPFGLKKRATSLHGKRSNEEDGDKLTLKELASLSEQKRIYLMQQVKNGDMTIEAAMWQIKNGSSPLPLKLRQNKNTPTTPDNHTVRQQDHPPESPLPGDHKVTSSSHDDEMQWDGVDFNISLVGLQWLKKKGLIDRSYDFSRLSRAQKLTIKTVLESVPARDREIILHQIKEEPERSISEENDDITLSDESMTMLRESLPPLDENISLEDQVLAALTHVSSPTSHHEQNESSLLTSNGVHSSQNQGSESTSVNGNGHMDASTNRRRNTLPGPPSSLQIYPGPKFSSSQSGDSTIKIQNVIPGEKRSSPPSLEAIGSKPSDFKIVHHSNFAVVFDDPEESFTYTADDSIANAYGHLHDNNDEIKPLPSPDRKGDDGLSHNEDFLSLTEFLEVPKDKAIDHRSMKGGSDLVDQNSAHKTEGSAPLESLRFAPIETVVFTEDYIPSVPSFHSSYHLNQDSSESGGYPQLLSKNRLSSPQAPQRHSPSVLRTHFDAPQNVQDSFSSHDLVKQTPRNPPFLQNPPTLFPSEISNAPFYSHPQEREIGISDALLSADYHNMQSQGRELVPVPSLFPYGLLGNLPLGDTLNGDSMVAPIMLTNQFEQAAYRVHDAWAQQRAEEGGGDDRLCREELARVANLSHQRCRLELFSLRKENEMLRQKIASGGTLDETLAIRALDAEKTITAMLQDMLDDRDARIFELVQLLKEKNLELSEFAPAEHPPPSPLATHPDFEHFSSLVQCLPEHVVQSASRNQFNNIAALLKASPRSVPLQETLDNMVRIDEELCDVVGRKVELDALLVEREMRRQHGSNLSWAPDAPLYHNNNPIPRNPHHYAPTVSHEVLHGAYFQSSSPFHTSSVPVHATSFPPSQISSPYHNGKGLVQHDRSGDNEPSAFIL